jgi:hypothetical protein
LLGNTNFFAAEISFAKDIRDHAAGAITSGAQEHWAEFSFIFSKETDDGQDRKAEAAPPERIRKSGRNQTS